MHARPHGRVGYARAAPCRHARAVLPHFTDNRCEVLQPAESKRGLAARLPLCGECGVGAVRPPPPCEIDSTTDNAKGTATALWAVHAILSSCRHCAESCRCDGRHLGQRQRQKRSRVRVLLK
jgi:hypothetical protein